MVQVFKGEVVDVYSGDDLVAMIDLGVEDLFKRQRIRLHGVDTPNAVGYSDDTPAGDTRSYVRRLCKGKNVQITVVNNKGRSWVVILDIILEDGTTLNLNNDLIAKGYEFKRERQNG